MTSRIVCLEPTDQGLATGWMTHARRLEVLEPSLSGQPGFAPRDAAGVYPILRFLSCQVCWSSDCDPSCSRSGSPAPEAGGDEETRTPDPLLAKEMLFQLSYVPLPKAGWSRDGRWWAFLDSNQRPLPYQGSALTN